MIVKIIVGINKLLYNILKWSVTKSGQLLNILLFFVINMYRVFLIGSSLVIGMFNKPDLGGKKLVEIADQFVDEYSEDKVFSREPLSKSKKLKLNCYTEHAEQYRKFEFKLQPLGYNGLYDENSMLAGIVWCGQQIRLKHNYNENLILDWLSKFNGRVLRILDVGTGNCCSIEMMYNLLYSNEKFNKLEEIKFYGCDISDRMLAHGVKLLYEKKIRANIVLCDGQDLPYNDNSFDLVTNFGSINQFHSYEKGLDEMYRVVKPEGLCMCRDEYFDRNLLTYFETLWFDPISDEKVPEYLPEKAVEIKIEKISKLNFVLSFQKRG